MNIHYHPLLHHLEKVQVCHAVLRFRQESRWSQGEACQGTSGSCQGEVGDLWAVKGFWKGLPAGRTRLRIPALDLRLILLAAICQYIPQ